MEQGGWGVGMGCWKSAGILLGCGRGEGRGFGGIRG
jgi:hypothetical protein